MNLPRTIRFALAVCHAAVWLMFTSVAAQANEPSTPDVAERRAEFVNVVVLQPFLVGGPLQIPQAVVGCRVAKSRRACRADLRPATAIDVKVLQTRGNGSRLLSSTLREGCADLEFQLGVDHRGPEGRVCLEPLGAVSVSVELR